MAMSFAPLCLKYETLQINDVDVVGKSYPNFWNDLKKGGFIIKTTKHAFVMKRGCKKAKTKRAPARNAPAWST